MNLCTLLAHKHCVIGFQYSLPIFSILNHISAVCEHCCLFDHILLLLLSAAITD